VPISDTRPGLNTLRMVGLMRRAIERCGLDLTGLTVLTEAASGSYIVTPVLSALAGARTYALSATTAYASAAELEKMTLELAEAAGVAGRITLIPGKDPAITGVADIVTNSGQVRPIDAAMIADMRPSCVIPLMYESWEFRQADVDLPACRARGIRVAGTNERHPAVDVFSFLGQMAVKLLHDAGVSVYGSNITLLCDNHFRPYIADGLRASGADLAEASILTGDSLSADCDAVLLARTPGPGQEFSAAEARLMASGAPGAILAQYWGDADREALATAGVPVWPERAPGRGHMGVLPSAIGPEPVIRLQAGGLKVGQVLARGLGQASAADQAFIQEL
jgi:hypothetical protein